MARYKVRINTDAYKCRPCNKKNWEPGTMNDFMIALNGWHTTEHNIKEVIWRLKMFAGCSYSHAEWDEEKQDWREDYVKWNKKKCNMITFQDRLCGFTRTHPVCGYGFTQGYFSIDDIIKKLKLEGNVRIPFEWLYDIRQKNYKTVKGCYMEIVKCK